MLTQEITPSDQVSDYLIGLARKHPWRPTAEPLHPRHRRRIQINGHVFTVQFILVRYGVRKFYSLKIIPHTQSRPADDLCKYLAGYFFKGEPEDQTEHVLHTPHHADLHL